MGAFLFALLGKRYKVEKINMEGLKPPYMLLSNHMYFIDFELCAMGTFPHRVNILANFAAHILHGEPLCADGTEGLKTAQLTNGAYLSGWKQCKVALPVDNDAFLQEFAYRQELEKKKN